MNGFNQKFENKQSMSAKNYTRLYRLASDKPVEDGGGGAGIAAQKSGPGDVACNALDDILPDDGFVIEELSDCGKDKSMPSDGRKSSDPVGVNHVLPTECLTVSKSEAAITGELYPGRPLCRPRILFKNGKDGEGWNERCEKDYRYHRSHSPGLFTVQCACKRPKLLGITVMNRSESISTALTSLLSRFPVLPTVCLYDNACNFSQSTRLRLPWVLEETQIVTDRFHYKSHKCASVMDPDTYPVCDDLHTSGAEALNRRWAASKNHIRYLAGDNLVPFLYARALFLNLRARVREKKKASDIEDFDINGILNEELPCRCERFLRAVDDDTRSK